MAKIAVFFRGRGFKFPKVVMLFIGLSPNHSLSGRVGIPVSSQNVNRNQLGNQLMTGREARCQIRPLHFFFFFIGELEHASIEDKNLIRLKLIIN